MANVVNRKCVGCNQIFDRSELIKITLNGGKLHVSPSSKILGRSLYVCKNKDCVKNLIKKKRIQTALKFKNFEEVLRCEEEISKIFS